MFSNIPLGRDVMSLQRCMQVAKTVKKGNGFPNDMHLVQEMLEAADLTPPIIHTVPEMKFVNNVAANHEMFECHWVRES